MKTESEVKVVQPQTWNHQKLEETRILPKSLWREPGSADTLIQDFWPPHCERINSYCSMPPSLWQPEQINTPVKGYTS